MLQPLMCLVAEPAPIAHASLNAGEAQPTPLPFNKAEIEAFRYRVEDVRRSVTTVMVRDARMAELKKEVRTAAASLCGYRAFPPQQPQLPPQPLITAALCRCRCWLRLPSKPTSKITRRIWMSSDTRSHCIRTRYPFQHFPLSHTAVNV